MSTLQHLIDELNDTTRALAEISSASADDRADEILRINLESIEKRRDDLGRRIDEYLAISQKSMVQYRIQRQSSEQYPAKAVGEALEKFQDLLTSVYDALINGPKSALGPRPKVLRRRR